MSNNTEIFTGKAKAYDLARPTYAQNALHYLQQKGLNSNSVVADIGAGTGIFSRQLLECGAEVYAVELNAEMREYAEENLRPYTKAHVVKASAEETSLAANSVDFITVAQAFHWFDTLKFKQECLRILKPSGRVAILWNNSTGTNDEVWIDLQKLTDKYTTTKKPDTNKAETVIEKLKLFYKTYEEKTFDNPLSYDKERFVLSFLSTSRAPKPEEKDYALFLDHLENLFDRYQKDGKLVSPNQTVLYFGEI